MRKCNDELLLIGLIEDKEGVDCIEAIMAEGLDVGFIGRADLSTSLGVPGQLDHPVVATAVKRTLDAVKRSGCVAGNLAFSASETKELVDQGFQFIVFATDTQVLMDAFNRTIQEIRQALTIRNS
jgi:2-keto-3-deoxy-L-rhamnonate aldolase RhmA